MAAGQNGGVLAPGELSHVLGQGERLEGGEGERENDQADLPSLLLCHAGSVLLLIATSWEKN